MNTKSDFQWVVHASSLGKKKGLGQVKLKPNEKLLTKYRSNDDYDIELHVNEKKYRKNCIQLTKTKAKINEGNNVYKCIPYQFFENSTKWLVFSSMSSAVSNWKDLAPLVFWSGILYVFLYLGLEASNDNVTIAVQLLVKENASKVTVFLGSLGFMLFSLIYFITPARYVNFERFISFTYQQFFGLVIGASSFCLASHLISISKSLDVSNNVVDSITVVIICFLVHYSRWFNTELNNFLDGTGRFIFLCVLAVIVGLAFFVNK
ncbi:hypothetical protein L1D40_12715 [Shewanella insulae]|uniref:hypothetical protein n=1 Tax=Shewanella insulae TaxID=2681496 RepID=UPI001EFCBC01|nr:hypothetical protein [Shewanella insulae]MCG9756076.1 hypothetical protein [Shewanella insulae]